MNQLEVFIELLRGKPHKIIRLDIIDGTGIGSRGKDRELEWRRGEENRIVSNHSKLWFITVVCCSRQCGCR